MLHELFSVNDLKAKVFHPPMFHRNAGEATRGFVIGCQKEDSPLFMFPEDFTLNSVGFFNDEDGTLTPHTPKIIMTASQAVKQKS